MTTVSLPHVTLPVAKAFFVFFFFSNEPWSINASGYSAANLAPSHDCMSATSTAAAFPWKRRVCTALPWERDDRLLLQAAGPSDDHAVLLWGPTLPRHPRLSAASSGARDSFEQYAPMSCLYGENQPVSPLCVHLSKEYVDDIMSI